MATPLRISLVQVSLLWEDKARNLARFGRFLKRVEGKTDLAVLPETFTTGFSMNVRELGERMDGPTTAWLKEQAAYFQFAITGSFIARNGKYYYNRGFFITPDGGEYYYDKRHLFRMAGERESFTQGKEQVVVPYKSWNICLQICYDLRFPVWSRNVGNAYDLLIYVANWPAPRHLAWTTLLPARAAENQAFVCGVNCIGNGGDGMKYLGGSAVYSPKGEKLTDSGTKKDFIRTFTIDKDGLDAFRAKFPAWQDADPFTLKH
jgi:predicted amidohydrolase